MLEKSLGLSFPFQGENFQIQPRYYEDETIFSNKETVGVVFDIRNDKGQPAGEVVGYLYSEDGKRKFLVQWTENKTTFTDHPVRGLVQQSMKELLQRKIDTWISSAELNDKSSKMYEKAAEDPNFVVKKGRGNDFRNKDGISFTVERGI